LPWQHLTGEVQHRHHH